MKAGIAAALLLGALAACTKNVYGPDRVTCIEERPDTVATVSAGGQPLAYIVQPLCWRLQSNDGKVWVRIRHEDGSWASLRRLTRRQTRRALIFPSLFWPLTLISVFSYAVTKRIERQGRK